MTLDSSLIGIGITIIGSVASVGIFIGVNRAQTELLIKNLDKLGDRVDKCVTKSDFPLHFAKARRQSQHEE